MKSVPAGSSEFPDEVLAGCHALADPHEDSRTLRKHGQSMPTHREPAKLKHLAVRHALAVSLQGIQLLRAITKAWRQAICHS